VVELASLSANIIDYIPQTAAADQLRCQQGDKLEPAGKRPEFLPDMVLIGKGLKFMSRKNTHYLRKNGAAMWQAWNSPVLLCFLAKSL